MFTTIYCHRRKFVRTLLAAVAMNGAITTVAQSGSLDIFQTSLGSRASAFSQVTMASSVDSSAIWYNPAGLADPSSTILDFTLDIGTLPDPQATDTQENIAPKLFAVSTKLSNLTNNIVGDWPTQFSVGVGYFHPYRLKANVTEARSLLSDTAIGQVTFDYRQLSLAAAFHFSRIISVGSSLDALFSSFHCLDNFVCDQETAASPGFSLGVMTSPLTYRETSFSFSLMYRSGVNTESDSTTTNAAIAEINRYLVGRPDQFSFGARVQIPVITQTIAEINTLLEYYDWTSATNDRRAIHFVSRYLRAGLSGEIRKAISSQIQISMRGGSHIDRAIGTQGLFSPSFGAGAGLAYRNEHFVELAAERQNAVSSQTIAPVYLLSFSYSYQY